MNQTTFDVKKNFLSRTFSRCLAEMCPGVVRLEYHLHDDGDEVAIIRCVNGSTRRVVVTGMDLQGSVEAILAELNGASMRRVVVWQDGRPKCRYIGCAPTPEEQRSLRRGGCEIRVDGKPVSRIIREGEKR